MIIFSPLSVTSSACSLAHSLARFWRSLFSRIGQSCSGRCFRASRLTFTFLGSFYYGLDRKWFANFCSCNVSSVLLTAELSGELLFYLLLGFFPMFIAQKTARVRGHIKTALAYMCVKSIYPELFSLDQILFIIHNFKDTHIKRISSIFVINRLKPSRMMIPTSKVTEMLLQSHPDVDGRSNINANLCKSDAIDSKTILCGVNLLVYHLVFLLYPLRQFKKVMV